MNTRILFILCAILPSVLATKAWTQTPLLPSENGTYYYMGYDAGNDRYVYSTRVATTDEDTGQVTFSGTYYYVDSTGVTTVGEANDVVPGPYRAVVNNGENTFQFYNAHAGLATLNPSGTSQDYAVRSGTWSVSDITYTLTGDADGSGIWLVGYTGTTLHPVAYTGSNVNVFVTSTANGSRQAISIRSGASLSLSGGTISKVGTANADYSETFYIVGNQEGLGSTAHFRGEDLTIISSGRALETFNQGNGNTFVELYRSTISSTISGANPNTQVFNLNDQQGQGGAHFYGENLTIDVVNTSTFSIRTFGIGYGANTITLKDSTITTAGNPGPIFRWKTSEGTGGYAGGNEAMADGLTSVVTLENTTVTSNGVYAPIFHQTGRLGKAIVTNGTLTTTEANSPIIRLVGANDAKDESKFAGLFTNVVLDAQKSSVIDIDMKIKDALNSGEDGGGVGKEVTTLISTTWDFFINSSTLQGTTALRMATAGAHHSPYSNWTNLYVKDSTVKGAIEMHAGLQASGTINVGHQETSGANLLVQSHNSHFSGGFYITGTEDARKTHQARIEFFNSTWEGDIVATNRGETVLYFTNSPLENTNFALSGSTNTFIDLINSPITGGISLDGTATLINSPGRDVNGRFATVHNSSITGGFSLAGLSKVDLTFTGDTVVSNGIQASGSATGTFRFEEGTSINGGVELSGTASITIKFASESQFTGDLVVNDRAKLALSTFAGTPIYLNRSFTLGGIWSVPVKTTLEGSLDLTNQFATIHLPKATEDTLVLASGLTGNGRLAIDAIDGTAFNMDRIRVIEDKTNSLAPDALILAHPVEYGLARYTLENQSDGAYLVGGLNNGSFGDGGGAVINTQAMAVEDWFASLASVNHRLSQIRQNNADVFSGVSGASQAQGDAGGFWFEARADSSRVDFDSSFRDFESRTIGLTAGVDARWDFDTATFTAGIFADTSRTDRDFAGTADGRTTSAGGGVYISYHHRKGLFLSAIGRYDIHENTLDSNNHNNALGADFHSQAGGAAFEAGWHFDYGTGWWFEPSYQIALATFPSVSYTTDSTRTANNGYNIETEDGRATQHAFRFAVGKSFAEKWHFRAHLLLASTDASGSELKIKDNNMTNPMYTNFGSFTIANDRVEVSVGIARNIGANGRLGLDIAYSEADDYTRPYSVFLGYSHRW
ncbi:outer membrane autotransporter protein [Ereboglobus sp. PH5-5]|uniref:autotransporter outer membrane beta-barrel domain-containing protein n=1 Tax=Ereboglobus sp. PH5-5 TaxID=2940529 RepID=UPI0024051B99|nr:autotransporter outer membrane beta-barrel domain-containing protein [Ereboglobus sp. PH5-5]MDF9832163.1 outer membrane autotransporter protein [Ereboglobus sp. PH5-5]